MGIMYLSHFSLFGISEEKSDLSDRKVFTI